MRWGCITSKSGIDELSWQVGMASVYKFMQREARGRPYYYSHRCSTMTAPGCVLFAVNSWCLLVQH